MSTFPTKPEVSSYPLMTAKSSIFIPCIYLMTLTYFDWTSGVWIASYSRRFKCIRLCGCILIRHSSSLHCHV